MGVGASRTHGGCGGRQREEVDLEVAAEWVEEIRTETV